MTPISRRGRVLYRRLKYAFTGALLASIFILVALPIPLGLLAGGLSRRSNEALRRCEEGVALARWADRLYGLQGLSPLFSKRAREGRVALIRNVQNGLSVCDVHPSPGFSAEGEGFLIEALPRVVVEPEVGFGPRAVVEAYLHSRGRDRAILEIARRLPQGGDVLHRVTAHLYLGDLEGAAATWRAPDTTIKSSPLGFVLERTTVLCMAGEMKALEPIVPKPSRSAWATLAQAECLLRQGRFEALERLTRAPRWRAEIAIARGDLVEARRHSAMLERPALDDHLRAFWLAVKAGVPAEALREMELSKFLSSAHFDPDVTLYNIRYWPPLHERRLSEVAEALEGLDALHDLAARARLIEAIHLGQRWDPRFKATIDRAEALAPGWDRPGLVRTAFAWFHGDWAHFDAQPSHSRLWELQDARAMIRERAGDPPSRAPWRDNVILRGLGPDVGLPTALAELMRSPFTKAQKWSILKEQISQVELTTLFCRLSLQVTFGRLLEQDVSAQLDQLEALRAMYDTQPNPRLLMGWALRASFYESF